MPALTASYSGFVNGDTVASLTTQPTLSTTATAASSVGSYVITASGAASTNYAITYSSGSITVTPAALTIGAVNKSKVYGAAMPTLTASYSGFVNGDTAASLTTQPTLSTTATAASSVGSYVITASGAASANYAITYSSGSLTVTPAALTIGAVNKSKVYGAAMPTLTASYSGFVNGDTVASLTTQPTLSTTATAASSVGSYVITASGAASENYAITYSSGSLTVTPAALTIGAVNKSKVYGAAMPALTASYSGFVNGDTVASLTTQPTLSTTATAASSVGSYVITASGAASANYAITYSSGSLTVTPAALTIGAVNKSKVYGAAMPTLTASYSGFVNGDTVASLTTQPTLSTTATAASSVGSYVITASGAASANYAITYSSGSLTVTPAALTITADNKTKITGDPLPSLTATYSGLVNGDTAANLSVQSTLSTTATATSPAGSYAITVAGAVSPNYTITQVAGTITVMSMQNAAYLMSDPLNATQMALYVFGTQGNDVIQIAPTTSTGDFSVTLNKVSLGVFHPTSRIVVHGLNGNDSIGLSDVTVSAWIFGDAGDDTLWGGRGVNLLMGGDGNDTLWGGRGRNLLFGGAGKDTLVGGLGDSLLIGGTTTWNPTDFSAKSVALQAILNEWDSSATSAVRIAHITGQSGGINGQTFLNASTIQDDRLVDSLLGGSAVDLFFQGLGDSIQRKTATDATISAM